MPDLTLPPEAVEKLATLLVADGGTLDTPEILLSAVETAVNEARSDAVNLAERLNAMSDVEEVEDPEDAVELSASDDDEETGSHGDKGHFREIGGHTVFIPAGGHGKSPKNFAKVVKSKKGYHLKHHTGELLRGEGNKVITKRTPEEARAYLEEIHANLKAGAKVKTTKLSAADSAAIELSAASAMQITDRLELVQSRIDAAVAKGDLPVHLGKAFASEFANEADPDLYMLSRDSGTKKSPLDRLLKLFDGSGMGVKADGPKTKVQTLSRVVPKDEREEETAKTDPWASRLAELTK